MLEVFYVLLSLVAGILNSDSQADPLRVYCYEDRSACYLASESEPDRRLYQLSDHRPDGERMAEQRLDGLSWP